MEYLKVPLSEIEPDPGNPRKEFGDLLELAAGFDLNPVSPHEPWHPLVLVRLEGGGYRIVDGERRWRAMRAAGKVSEAHALVFGEIGEAEAVVAMLATDDKLGLTDAERARGVQQALDLGVAPSKVDRAARLKKGTAKRVRAGMEAAGGRKFRQQSLDAVLLAAEHAGDDEVLDLIAGSTGSASSIGRDVDYLLSSRAVDKALGEVEALAAEMGVKVVKRPPRGARLLATLYMFHPAGVPGQFREKAGELGAGCVVLDRHDYVPGSEVVLYSAPADMSDPEAAALASANRVKRAHSEARRRRAAWVAERAVASTWPATLRSTMRYLRGRLASEKWRLAPFFRTAGVGEAPEGLEAYVGPWELAEKWDELDSMNQADAAEIATGYGARMGEKAKIYCARRHAALMDALMSDGYGPDGDEEALLGACRKIAVEADAAGKEG